jgi:hypothetical protein
LFRAMLVACRLEPWCICEVPEEVVSRVQPWKREAYSHVRLVKLLLIWRRDWRRHFFKAIDRHREGAEAWATHLRVARNFHIHPLTRTLHTTNIYFTTP